MRAVAPQTCQKLSKVSKSVVYIRNSVESILCTLSGVKKCPESTAGWPADPGSSPLQVPAAHSVVRVAGYPLGGIAVSITDGVVSRVIGMEYEFNQPMSINAPGSAGSAGVSEDGEVGRGAVHVGIGWAGWLHP